MHGPQTLDARTAGLAGVVERLHRDPVQDNLATGGEDLDDGRLEAKRTAFGTIGHGLKDVGLAICPEVHEREVDRCDERVAMLAVEG